MNLFRNRFFFILFFFILIGKANTQNYPMEYMNKISEAREYYKAKEYKNSALAYSAAFKSFGWKGNLEDRYHAACSWALSGNPDSAFFCLDRIVNRLFFDDYERVKLENDFISLHNDPRWLPLFENIKQNKLLNFGFEKVHPDSVFPVEWFRWNGADEYTIVIDSVEKHSGKYSLRISSELFNKKYRRKHYSAAVGYRLPKIFIGDTIEIKAFVKTKKVDSMAGLFLRIENFRNQMIGYRDLEKSMIHGTNDWTEFFVKLPRLKDTYFVFIGADLKGNGTLWVDDFQVLVDGKDIQVSEFEK